MPGLFGAQGFLTAFALVLGAAALTTVVFQRLRQPVVLGYLLAGLIIGPYLPVPLVANTEVVHALSELGVILLMFGLGLELDLVRLVRAMPRAGTTALLQCSTMLWLGYVTGLLLGWTHLESIFAGAVISISSTTIIAKAFDEQGVHGRLRELVVAILIVEDLIAVFLIAVLTGVASGSGLSASELVLVIGKLVGFLALFVAIGLLVVPRLIRAIVRLKRSEITIVGTIAVCFGSALLAHEVGYSTALGAFVGGVLVGESRETKQIEPLVQPLRDIFAAVFFVSVGMMIDPAMIAEHWVAIVVLTVVVIVGKLVSVAVGAFLTGQGTRTSIAAGMSLAQIGEFSFIIAALGGSLGAVRGHLYPVAVAVSAITTLTTPWLIRAADPVGRFVDRKLPAPLQTFVGFYESWIERLRASRPKTGLRRLVRTLVLDVLVVAALVIGFAVGFGHIVAFLVEAGLAITPARIITAAVAGAAVLPFCAGMLVTTRRLAKRLAEAVVPPVDPGMLDLGRPSRTLLEATVLLAGVVMAGLPLVALTQPFLSGYAGAITFLVAVSLLAIVVWRRARNLHGHVRAVSHVVVEALASRAAGRESGVEPPADVLSGLGTLERISITPASFAAHRSLADLALRATTGATVLAILRDGHGIAAPDAHDPLHPGDLLAIAGTREAIAAATALLARGHKPR